MSETDEQVLVRIRNVATGEVREGRDLAKVDLAESNDPDSFYWSDGNMACDCCRQLSFIRYGGEQYAGELDPECGDSRYQLNLKRISDGKVFYKEFDE